MELKAQASVLFLDITPAASAVARLYSATALYNFLIFVVFLTLLLGADSDFVGAGAWLAVQFLFWSATFVVAMIANTKRSRQNADTYRWFSLTSGLMATGVGLYAARIWWLVSTGIWPAEAWLIYVPLAALAAYFTYNVNTGIAMQRGSSSSLGSVSATMIAAQTQALYSTCKRSHNLIHAPHHPLRVALYAVLFLMVLLLFFFVPTHITLSGNTNVPTAWIFVALLSGAAHTAGMVRRHYALPADKLLAMDTRDPVLFLRSFDDDRTRIPSMGGLIRKARPRSVEESIADRANLVGPFVALASPDTPLPELGAAKFLATDRTWQTCIESWIQLSRLIVMVAGRSQSVQWEIDQIMMSGTLHKLIVLVPPDSIDPRMNHAIWLNEYFRRTRYAEAVNKVDVREALALVFHPNQLIVIRRARHRKTEADFLVAFDTALWSALIHTGDFSFEDRNQAVAFRPTGSDADGTTPT